MESALERGNFDIFAFMLRVKHLRKSNYAQKIMLF